MTTRFQPLPAPGDIVWCLFPQVVGKPGPKPRPALVMAVSKTTYEVEVVYGTSQKTDKLYQTEFVIDPSDGGYVDSGLAARTKFDMAERYQLPFDTDWFAAAPGFGSKLPIPKLGVLHPSYYSLAKKAADAAQRKKKSP